MQQCTNVPPAAKNCAIKNLFGPPLIIRGQKTIPGQSVWQSKIGVIIRKIGVIIQKIGVKMLHYHIDFTLSHTILHNDTNFPDYDTQNELQKVGLKNK